MNDLNLIPAEIFPGFPNHKLFKTRNILPVILSGQFGTVFFNQQIIIKFFSPFFAQLCLRQTIHSLSAIKSKYLLQLYF